MKKLIVYFECESIIGSFSSSSSSDSEDVVELDSVLDSLSEFSVELTIG